MPSSLGCGHGFDKIPECLLFSRYVVNLLSLLSSLPLILLLFIFFLPFIFFFRLFLIIIKFPADSSFRITIELQLSMESDFTRLEGNVPQLQ